MVRFIGGPAYEACAVFGLFGRMGVRLVVGLIIFAALGVGGFFFRDFLSSSVTQVRVGDCIDLPIGAERVQDVQHHPCTDNHVAEVISVTTYAATGAYPSEDSLVNYAENICVLAFSTYTGRDWTTEVELTMGYMLPTPDGWDSGDHDVACYVRRDNGTPLTQSVRAA